MFECCRKEKSIFLGLFLMFLLVFPPMVNGKESTYASSKSNAEIQPSTSEASSSPSARFMNWARRFGNRVGENLSEAHMVKNFIRPS